LERRFAENGYRKTALIQGTYGLVWILESDRPSVWPRAFAVKTYDPGKPTTVELDVRVLFERELALWLRVPTHRNVLSALGLELASINSGNESGSEGSVTVPFVRMPRMDYSLDQWAVAVNPTFEERLVALAQLCSGLSWLYKHGIQGHGDLKPQNVLLRDIESDYGPVPNAPRWLVKVSDLGWADIWRELVGGDAARKAWRPYLAPERIDGEVVPMLSDMFAVGVMGVELLGGEHPAGKPTARIAKWNDSKYGQWAASADRVIPQAIDPPVGQLLQELLSPKPKDRPSPNEVIDRLCRAVKTWDLRDYIRLWDEEGRGFYAATHDAAAAETAGALGGHQLDQSILELEQVHSSPDPLPTATEPTAKWLAASSSLARLLVRRSGLEDRARAFDVAIRTLRYVVRHFERLDLRAEVYPDPWGSNASNGGFVPSDLEAAEVSAQFAHDAIRVLSGLGRADEEEVRQLRRESSERYRASQPSFEVVRQRLLTLANPPSDKGNE
jgi:serine/threonine protein kinase